MTSIHVRYFGTYRDQYSRNRIMIEALRRTGAQVSVCHERLWTGPEDRVLAATQGWRNPRFLGRLAWAYAKLVVRFLKDPECDLVMLGYPGQLDVYIVRLLTWLTGKPLVWDVFMSIYIIAMERSLDQRSRISIKFLRRLERWATRLPDLLILNTDAYQDWFQVTYGVDPGKVRLVPTGADDRVFHPMQGKPGRKADFLILYYGTFIPNHGLRDIAQAAKALHLHTDIQFMLIGEGPEKEMVRDFCTRQGLNNVQFGGWMDQEALRQRIAEADLCLGAFGTTPQSLMTIQNKIYEAMAMGRPVLTGDSKTARDHLEHGVNVYLCKRDSPQDLANAVLELKENSVLLQKIAAGGRALYVSAYTPERLGLVLQQHLQELLRGNSMGPRIATETESR